ncbi:MAG: hypothetical protein JNK82_37350 [Myxococcaceae bacterium]|nr:hypothetical protein [Myxococcaceae bacterium]
MTAALVTLLLAVAPAPAGLPGGSALHAHLPNVLETVKVGEWVTYRFDPGDGREYFWRIAIVGEELDRLGRPAVWVELDVGNHHAMKAPIAQMKVLASRAQGLSAQGVTRMFSAFGIDRPREVEPSELPKVLLGEAEKKAAEVKRPREVTTRRGEPTRLMTAGGTVSAAPHEVRLGGTLLKRYWVSEAIPILHLAKIEFPAVQHAMEARDWGLDAKAEMATPDPAAATIRMEGAK